MRLKPRAVVPLEFQAGLPPGVLYQPLEVGGSLGFGGKGELEPFWDKLEAEAEAMPDLGLPGAAANLRQNLNDFVFEATTVSRQVLPYSPTRIYLMLQNRGSADVFVSFGHTATLNGFEIPSGPGFYEPILGTVSSVHMIAASGTQPVTVVEGFRS